MCRAVPALTPLHTHSSPQPLAARHQIARALCMLESTNNVEMGCAGWTNAPDDAVDGQSKPLLQKNLEFAAPARVRDMHARNGCGGSTC